MSEEKSSSSTSSSSLNSLITKALSNETIMKRQNSDKKFELETENIVVANSSNCEETKEKEYQKGHKAEEEGAPMDNTCKKRRRSDQVDDNDADVLVGADNNSAAVVVDKPLSLMSFEQPSGSKCCVKIGGLTVALPSKKDSELGSGAKGVEPKKLDIGLVPMSDEGAVGVEAEPSVNGGETEENSLLSSPENISQRSRRMRRRSYRRYLPDLSSDSDSFSPPELDEHDMMEDFDIDIMTSPEDGDRENFDRQFRNFPLLRAVESSSNDEFNFFPSSDDDLSLEDEELVMFDNDDHNIDSGDGTPEGRVKRILLKVVDEVLSKTPAPCTWNPVSEVLWRELGIMNRGSANNYDSRSTFNSRFYGSQFVVERMKLSNCLRRHNGCVNSLNFNSTGDLLCSGSDDKRIVIWDWAHNVVKHAFASGHWENIFQTKFITSGTALDIVSAGRDGQVRRSMIPSSGSPITSCLYKHRNPVHKVVISPNDAFEILSVGEDGCIRQWDLRNSENSLPFVKVHGPGLAQPRVRLFSISHHPYAPEVCVCGSDEYVRVYDKRKFNEPARLLCPSHLKTAGNQFCYSQVTCCTYNCTGSEILATYSDEYIYLFDNKVFKEEAYLHRYRGHNNHRTIKGVNFFGPRSEYVISGSDCGHIFFWDKESEAIVNFMSGDSLGVVNCLEPHPSVPVLATSGLDHTVKVWTPGSVPTVPNKKKMKNFLVRNIRHSFLQGRGDFLDLSLNEIIMQSFRADASEYSGSDASYGDFVPGIDNSSTDTDSSNSSLSIDFDRPIFHRDDSSDNDVPMNDMTCRTQ